MPQSVGYLNSLGAYSDDPGFIGPVLPPEFSSPGDYEGADSDTSSDTQEFLKDFEFWTGIFAGATDLTRNFLKANADSNLKKSMEGAKNKIDQGKQGMMDYGQKIGQSVENINQTNENLTTLSNNLFDIGNGIASQLNALGSLTQSLNVLDQQLYQQTMQLEVAQARLDQAMARTDFTSLGEKRVEIKSANSTLRDINLAVNETGFQIASFSESYNTVGSQLAENVQSANSVRQDISQTYEQNQAFRQALASNVNGYNQSASTMSSGFGDVRQAVNSYQEFNTNVLSSMAEGSAGVRGLGQIAGAVAGGRYGEATAVALKGGVDAYVRNGGPVELAVAQGLIGSAIIGAGRSIDNSIKSGANFETAVTNFAIDMGQATLRTTDALKVFQGMDTAYTVLNNTTNPDRVYLASQIAVQQIGPAVSIAGTWATTATSLVPGMQAFTPAVGIVAKALPALAQGSAQIAVETVNKISDSGVSGTVGNYPTRPIGRGLVTRESGGTPSALTIIGAGGVATLINSGKAVTIGLTNNNNFAIEASNAVNAIANTGAIKSTIPPGAVTAGD